MAVKIPPLLSKMSKSAQKAWYKRNNMEMPDEPVERSAAAAKRVKVAPRKASDVKPDSVRAINTARMAAYMAKGGRAPIGAAGSGGNSVMAGSNMSTVRGMISGIKAGFNPKVSLDPYESERAKKTGPRSLKLKKEEVDEAKNKDKKNQYVRQVGLKAMKAGKVDPARGHSPTRFGREILKKEEVEQVDELSTDLLTRYKKKAAVQASAADKAGDYNKGNKRFSGIIKATKKQLGNDMKKEEVEQVKEGAKEDAAELLGGPVKTKPKMPPGKRSPGSRYVRGLARKAMKAGMKKEEVEQIDERNMENKAKKDAFISKIGQDDKNSMIKSFKKMKVQKNFGQAAKDRHLKDIKKIPAIRYGRIEMRSDNDLEDYRSKNYKGSYEYSNVGEEVEQIDELKKSTLVSYVGKAAGRLAAASRLQRDFEKDGNSALAGEFEQSAQKKKVGIQKAANKLAKEEVEQVDELSTPTMSSYVKKVGAENKFTKKRVDGLNLALNKIKSNSIKKEEVEESIIKYIEEKLTAADPASKWISDFVKSDNPKFAGKNKKERIQQALGAYYAAKRGTNEEVEQVDEAIRGTIRSLKGLMVRRPADQAERDKLASDITANRKYNKGKKIGRVSGDVRKNAAGMTDAQKLVRTLYDKSGRSNKELGTKKFPYSEEVEQVEEGRLGRSMRGYAVRGGYGGNTKLRYQSSGERAREINVGLDDKQEKENARRAAAADKVKMKKEEVGGKTPETDTEVQLAKKHGDPKKITYGDVIKARIASAKKKVKGY